jgi:hypothetical protein
LERKEIILTPGKEISDVAPELLSDMQWSRVENLYSDKVGRFVPLRGLDNKLPDTIRFNYEPGGTVTAEKIHKGIEWNGYLFLVVEHNSNYVLIRLKEVSGSYTLAWSDGSENVAYTYSITDSDRSTYNLATSDVSFIPYSSELRVRVGLKLFLIGDYSGKGVYDYEGNELQSYGVDLLSETPITTYQGVLENRFVSTGRHLTTSPIDLYRDLSSIPNEYSALVRFDCDESDNPMRMHSVIVVAALFSDGQIGLLETVDDATVDTSGGNYSFPSVISMDEELTRSHEYDINKFANLFGFDVKILKASIRNRIDKILVFIYTLPDPEDISFSTDTQNQPEFNGRFIDISNNLSGKNFRLLETINVNNKDTYAENPIADFGVYNYDVDVTSSLKIRYDVRGISVVGSSDGVIPVTKLYAGYYVKLYDAKGNEQSGLKITNVIFSTSGSSPKLYNVTLTFDGFIDSSFLVGSTPTQMNDDVRMALYLSPIESGSYLTWHIGGNWEELKQLPLFTDVYPYNSAVKKEKYYPDLTDYFIWNNQAFAKTSEDGEEYYLRYSIVNNFDILPPDQVHEIALEEIQNIVPLNDRLIIIGQKGITQGNILSQDFYLEFSDSTAGIIRPGAYVVHNGILYFMSDQDVYAFNGNTVQSVLKNSMIKNYYRDNIKEAEGFIVYSKYYSGLIIFMSETKGLLINDFGTSRWVLDENMIFAITDSDGDMVLFDDSASGFKIDPTDVYSDEYYLEAKELNERAFSAKQLTDVFIDTSYEGDIEVVSKDLRTNVTSNIVRAVDSTFGIEKRMSPRLIFNALSLNFEFTDSAGDFEIGRIRLWLKNLGR